jgi:hypothetical protein
MFECKLNDCLTHIICTKLTQVYEKMLIPLIENIGAYRKMNALCSLGSGGHHGFSQDEQRVSNLIQNMLLLSSGTFVLCTPRSVSKNDVIVQFARANKNTTSTLFLDCGVQESPVSVAWFNKDVLGLTHKSAPMSEHMQNTFDRNRRVKLYLQSFDQAMRVDAASALRFIHDLHADGRDSGRYSVIVDCTDPRIAHAILDSLRGEAYWVPLETVEDVNEEPAQQIYRARVRDLLEIFELKT